MKLCQALCLIFKGELWWDKPLMITPFCSSKPWYIRAYRKGQLLLTGQCYLD